MARLRFLVPWAMLVGGMVVGLAAGAWMLGGEDESPAPEGAGGISPATPARSEASATIFPAPVEGAPAPDFELVSLDGERIRLSELAGDVIVVNFWATWCDPCREEMPILQRLYETHRDEGLVVLAVNFDEPAAEVEGFRVDFGLTFPVLLDPGGEVQKLYRILGYPTSFLIDRSGVISAVHLGILETGDLERHLENQGIG